MTVHSPYKTKGFTLLEAIVALVLMSSVGMALFSWLNTNLITLNRLQTVQQRQAATQNALSFINTLNPMRQPTGEQTIGIYRFTWQAEEIEGRRDAVSRQGGQGLYEVALYNVTLTAYDAETEAALTTFSVRQIGYKQVRVPNTNF